MEARLRLLALWHARRRAVDELLEPLLTHGPAAVDRVSTRLADLIEATDAERAAFDAFAAAVAFARVDGHVVATVQAGPPSDELPANHVPVDELAEARSRAERTRWDARAADHPNASWAGGLPAEGHPAAPAGAVVPKPRSSTAQTPVSDEADEPV